MRSIGLIAIAASAISAQTLSLGAIGGGRVTDDMTGGGAVSQSRHYVVGPEAGLDLPLGFGVEVDALYRREGYQSAFTGAIFSGVQLVQMQSAVDRANSWEFPMLLVYRLPAPIVKPFVEIGYAPRVIRGTVNSIEAELFPTPTSPAQVTLKTSWPTSRGVVVGAGARFGVGHLWLAPTLRYTHWNNAAIAGSYADGPSWESNQNQVDLMIGIAWTRRLH